MISKLFVFFVVINSLVAFTGTEGLLGDETDVKKAQDYVDDLKTKSTEDTEGNTTSGLTLLDHFNPMNYGPVQKIVGIAGGYFVDPVLMFGALPDPLSKIFGTLFAVLEAVAIAAFFRGVAA